MTRFTSEFGMTGGYRAPTSVERAALVEAVSSLFDGNPEEARTRLAELDYALDTFTDKASGRRFAEVSDAAARPGSANRGWGRVYVELGERPRWSVQVPHPVADRDTERLGVKVLRAAPGGVMVLAGAHRTAGKSGDDAADGAAEDAADEAAGGGGEAEGEGDVADMAHRTDSVFHAVIAELTRRGLPGIQLHGFADDSAPGTDAVVSTGAGDAAVEDGVRLAGVLRGKGVTACRAWATHCKLSGRTNEQGRLAAARETRFLHLELSRSVRASPRRMAATADAIASVTAVWSKSWSKS
ncbi:hypothetical protein MTF65_12585 [Streptomyces sp. APSN-46.1]|uniref:hypothetical protein n=1 Tax=Streptomyces sp. APSN-46.1 TaxID=2929049 RepID=UPI001FB37638|nr:hypothetical protein [Streptomyces sp. APSN-46.1]MCJ1678166.1 hypothetical protein [Streptomyces sp. APSN-46.1]